MRLLEKIKRHAAVATGNFESMFSRASEIPPLPAPTARLVAEINHPEPEIGRLDTMLSSMPEITASVIKTVNSSLYSLHNPVTSVRHALAMLGLKRIKEIALTFTIRNALPKPAGGVFDHEAFWIDSLTMALLAKSFTRSFMPEKEETAFTVALLSDMALPVLLSLWQEYYAPVLEEWQGAPGRLSDIERKHFGWDHGQAGAWIAKSWNLSEEMVSYIGAHNLTYEELMNCELDDTVALPISLASMAPSVLKPDPERSSALISAAVRTLGMTCSDVKEAVEEVRQSFHEARLLFGLPDRYSDQVFGDLIRAAEDAGDSC